MQNLPDQTLIRLLDAAPDAMITVDEAGLIVLVNLHAEELFGYCRDDLVGEPVKLLVRLAKPQLEPPVIGMHLSCQRNDGSEFLAEISTSTLATETGALRLTAIRDATERLEAEAERERLKGEAERVRVSAEADKAAAERVRLQVEVVRVKADGDKSVAEGVRLKAERVRVKAESDKIEAERVRVEAERVRVKAESDRVAEAERVRLVAESVRLEVEAERERLEGQLHQSQRMESLGQLAGGVAHDFNNLLAVILNYASFVAEELTKVAETPAGTQWRGPLRDVEQIQLAAQRASGLTRQLLAFARREVVRPRVLSLNLAISRMEQILRRTIGEQVELVMDLTAGLPTVIADQGQIEQVVLNLVINARDSMPGGGRISIDTTCVEFTQDAHPGRGVPPGVYVCCRIGDTGIGMSAEVRDRAFEPFFTTKPKGEGSGLGLATVYGIVTQSGGFTSIDSEPGVGTTVTVLLPATRRSAETDEADREDRTNVLRGTETILVVEDQEALREVARRILSRNGYTIITAAGGAEAIELATAHVGPIDLILTDVIMPKMQGPTVVIEVSKVRPDIRVLFMSGHAQPVIEAATILGKDFQIIEKPFNERTLLEGVRDVLDVDG